MTSDEPTSARPVPEPPATGADAWKNTPTSCWPTLADDPRVPERFRETVRRLDEVPERPVTEHAETYDAVHRDLRQALDGIERTG